MTHTTPPTTPAPLVPVPWGRKAELDKAGLLARVYTTCIRSNKGYCINSNLIRGFAKLQGRKIRSPGTYRGEFHWSEQVDEQWCMFVAPLMLKYAKMIDAYDHDGKHFNPPVKPPFGPVRFVGFCSERRDTVVQREERRERVNARVEEGKLVPGSRFRERQAPYVSVPAGQ